MRFIRTIAAVAPFFMKGSNRQPARKLAGLAFAYSLIGMGCVFLLCAGFVYISREYGTDLGFVFVGGTLMASGLIFLFLSRDVRVKTPAAPAKINDDPIANKIPESITNDPTFVALMKQINEHPIAATTIAAALGMLISKEYFGD